MKVKTFNKIVKLFLSGSLCQAPHPRSSSDFQCNGPVKLVEEWNKRVYTFPHRELLIKFKQTRITI